jgi:hypothetical protein
MRTAKPKEIATRCVVRIAALGTPTPDTAALIFEAAVANVQLAMHEYATEIIKQMSKELARVKS